MKINSIILIHSWHFFVTVAIEFKRILFKMIHEEIKFYSARFVDNTVNLLWFNILSPKIRFQCMFTPWTEVYAFVICSAFSVTFFFLFKENIEKVLDGNEKNGLLNIQNTKNNEKTSVILLSIFHFYFFN